MSKMNDFILQCDEAPTNDERFAEYKRRFDAYFEDTDFEVIDPDWYIKQDRDTKEMHRLQKLWDSVYKGED